MTVTRKNRKENGKRKSELGSKPHSKGEAFSRFNFTFLPKRIERKKTNLETKTNNKIKQPK